MILKKFFYNKKSKRFAKINKDLKRKTLHHHSLLSINQQQLNRVIMLNQKELITESML